MNNTPKSSWKINWPSALGELTIVTIGILIAFGINKWGESQRDQAKIQKYYSNLVTDLAADTLEFTQINEQIDQTIGNLFIVINHCKNQYPGKDTMPIFFFKNLKKRFEFFPKDATFQSLKYSGDFQLIDNLELKNKIVDHYNQYSVVHGTNDEFAQMMHDYMSPYLNERLDYALFRPNVIHPTDFMDETEFTNLLYTSYGLYLGIKDANAKAKQRAKELIEVLQKENS